MYGDPNSALRESAKYLKMAGNIPVGNRSFDYSQLDTLDPSQIGFDMASAETMADYDITKGMSDPTNSKIEEKVGKKILLLLNAIGSSETAQASFSDIFRQNMFPNDWDGNPDKLDFDIPNDTDGTIKGRMNTIAQAGKNVFSLLWLQSDNKQKLQQDFANMMDTYAQTSSDNKLIFRATDFLNIANINKDTVFNNRAALKIFVNVMDETAELLPGTQLKYQDANGIVQTVLIEDVIRGTF